MDINELRMQIDSIDDQLVRLFVQRMALAKEIGLYKKANAIPVLDATREEAKLREIAAKAGPDMANYACSLYKALFDLSRQYQNEVIK